VTNLNTKARPIPATIVGAAVAFLLALAAPAVSLLPALTTGLRGPVPRCRSRSGTRSLWPQPSRSPPPPVPWADSSHVASHSSPSRPRWCGGP
jgi:hypothetical protein